MRTVINGHRYNTETATYICQCAKGKLYRKYHSQEFFLCFNGKTITPISWYEAENIIRENGSSVYYRQMFADEGNAKRHNIDIPDAYYAKLRRQAGQQGVSIKEMLCILIDKGDRNRDRHKRQ